MWGVRRQERQGGLTELGQTEAATSPLLVETNWRRLLVGTIGIAGLLGGVGLLLILLDDPELCL